MGEAGLVELTLELGKKNRLCSQSSSLQVVKMKVHRINDMELVQGSIGQLIFHEQKRRRSFGGPRIQDFEGVGTKK